MNITRHFKQLSFPASLFCWTTIFIGVSALPSKGDALSDFLRQPQPLRVIPKSYEVVSGKIIPPSLYFRDRDGLQTFNIANYNTLVNHNILCKDITVKLTKTTYPNPPVPYTFFFGKTVNVGYVNITGTYLSNGCNYSIRSYSETSNYSPYGTPYLTFIVSGGGWIGDIVNYKKYTFTFGVDQLPQKADFIMRYSPSPIIK